MPAPAIVNYNPNTVTRGNVIELFPQHEETPVAKKASKCKGKSCEVHELSIEDTKRVVEYFEQNNKWIHYLLFVTSYNLARRFSDMCKLTWEDFFNPQTGNFRENLKAIKEQKTGKYASPKINEAVKIAIGKYLCAVGYDPATDDYKREVFYQFTGTHKGSVLSYSGAMYALKDVMKKLNIERNLGTHSSRKTFGKTSIELHKTDPNAMQIVSRGFNHSSEAVTRRYTGVDREATEKYTSDMGDFWKDYIFGDKTYSPESDSPMMLLDNNDLRELITMAYQAGCQNANVTDPQIHIKAVNDVFSYAEGVAK